MTVDESHAFAKWYFLILIFGSMLLGCSHYGKRIHVRNTLCQKCLIPLVEKCKPIDNKGEYKCKCVNCGNVLKYRGKR